MRERVAEPRRALDRSGERPRVPPLATGSVLDLQRGAGNHAVARMIAERRMLTRVLDPDVVSAMDGGRPDLARPRNLGALVAAYNDACPGDDTQESLDARMRTLDAIEHVIYDWFEDRRPLLDPDNHSIRNDRTLQGMFKLMDAVQSEHRNVVARVASSGARLWANDNPTGDARDELDALWADIVSGKGAFTYRPTIGLMSGNLEPMNPASLDVFKTEIMAALARLASRPKGRELLQALRTSKLPTSLQKRVEFFVSQLYKLTGAYDTPYVGAKAIPVNSPDAAPSPDLTSRGRGSTADVEVAPGVRDASMMDDGAKGTFVPSPTFVGIGHELIHASHYSRGSYYSSPTHNDNLPKHYGGDVEEFVTIAPESEREPLADAPVAGKSGPPMSAMYKLNAGLPTEAEIRAEHGIGIRHSHDSHANPFKHDVGPGDNPGEFVTDSLEWLEANWPADEKAVQDRRELDKRRAPADAAPAPAVAAPKPAGFSLMAWARSWLPW